MSVAARTDMPERLAMRGIAKSFGGVTVLDRVDFAIAPGEVVALLGANGAGKSTLMKILTGVYTRDAGMIVIDGAALAATTPRIAAAHGISFLPQEISVIPEMTVAENIAIGNLPVRPVLGFPRVDQAAMRARACAALEDLGFARISPDAFLTDLPVAERRIVEIARAVGADARVLVMDEPTAALTEQEADLIFAVIRKLKARRTSVVYISHYLKEVFLIADRIEVLRDGRNAGSFVTAEVSADAVVEAMLGRAAGQLFAERAPRGQAPEPLLTVDKLSTANGLEDVSLTVGRGEILGVFGLVGSGIEHLGRAIFGADGAPASGRLQLDGASYRPATPRRGKEAGIGFVTAERKKDGILADLTVRENLVAPFQQKYGRGPMASRRRETEATLRWIEGLGIRTSGPEQEMRTLSGGNQQKVCVARWLDPSVKLLVLEEPTRGVDIGARRELYAELTTLADQGLAILVLSSDVEEIAGLSDRSMVIDRGRIVARFDDKAPPGRLMAATAGHGGSRQGGSRQGGGGQGTPGPDQEKQA